MFRPRLTVGFAHAGQAVTRDVTIDIAAAERGSLCRRASGLAGW
jgi:hypothetical protein